MKVKVARLKIGDPKAWYADCPVCRNPAVGFYSSSSWWPCYVWADIHAAKHKRQAPTLVYVELTDAKR